MRSLKLWMMLVLLLGSAALNAEPLLPMPDSGSMTWGDWRFSWEIGDANDEGLVIRNVFWKNVKVLHKASVPVIRVKYRGGAQDIDSGCGPYRDRISSGNLSKFSGQFTNVVSRQFNNGNLLEIAVFAEIGGYDLYQAYYFHKFGRFEPMLYSSGWSCSDNQHENDHKHHPYWRLDFDVETTANRVRHARTDANNNMSFAQYSSESGFTVPSGTKNIVWTVSNNASGRVVQIRSPGNELADANGSPWFGFAVRDVGVRRYHFGEDQGWPFSTDSQLGFFTPVEVTEDQDVVFWSMGHLSHTWSQADVSHPDWHSRGWIVDVTW